MWVISPWCPSADLCLELNNALVCCSLWEYTTHDYSNLISHVPVTATERTVRMGEKEGSKLQNYIQNYTGATCRQGVLYSMIFIMHTAIRAASHWGLRAKKWKNNPSIPPEKHSLQLCKLCFLLIHNSLCMRKVINYFSGQELFLIFTKYLQSNESTETFSG